MSLSAKLLAPLKATTEISPRQMWWGRLGFYAIFALYFSWVLRQGEVFFVEPGLFRDLSISLWLWPAILGLLSTLAGFICHLTGRRNLPLLLICLALYTYFAKQAGPYHTQANVFFGCLVLITLPVIASRSAAQGSNGIRSLPFFLFLSYFYARVAFQKFHSLWMPDGNGMEALVLYPLTVTEWGRALFSQSWAQAVLAPGVIVVEFLLAAGIFCGIFFRDARLAAAVGMVGLHTALLLTTDFGYFPLYSLLAAGLVFPLSGAVVAKEIFPQLKVVSAFGVLVWLPMFFYHYDFERWFEWDLISYPHTDLIDLEFHHSGKEPSLLLRVSELPHSFSFSGEFAGPLWHFYFMRHTLRQDWLEGKEESFPMKKFVRYLCEREQAEALSVRVILTPNFSPQEKSLTFPCR